MVPRSAKIPLCRYYEQNGMCNDGEKCRFRHGSRDARDIKTPTLAAGSIDLPCRYLAAGRCDKGQRCPFRHSTYSVEENLRRKHFANKPAVPPSRPGGATVAPGVTPSRTVIAAAGQGGSESIRGGSSSSD
ncbi:unnamed protein product, partial [Phaeothamnion confervicola]